MYHADRHWISIYSDSIWRLFLCYSLSCTPVTSKAVPTHIACTYNRKELPYVG